MVGRSQAEPNNYKRKADLLRLLMPDAFLTKMEKNGIWREATWFSVNGDLKYLVLVAGGGGLREL